MANVVMYSSALCPFCYRAQQLLQSKGVEFEVLSVDGDPDVRRQMMDRSGRHTVPQIFIGATHVGGCDELYALERAQRLDALLQAA